MKTYKELINEVNYQSHHDDLEVDSRLAFMAVKHHLREPKNFQKFIDNVKTPKHELVKAFNDYRHHEIKISHLDHVDSGLKQKYKKLNVIFSPRPKGMATALAPVRGATSVLKPEDEHVNMEISNFESLKHENVSTKPIHQVHSEFLKELDHKFHTWNHEFTHVHQQAVLKKTIGPPKSKDRYEGSVEYHNSPHEVQAFNRDLDYHMGKTFRNHPHVFDGLRTIDGENNFKEKNNHVYYGDMRIEPKFNDKESHHYNILYALDSHIRNTTEPDHGTSFSNAYLLRSKEHRGQYDDIIQKHLIANHPKFKKPRIRIKLFGRQIF